MNKKLITTIVLALLIVFAVGAVVLDKNDKGFNSSDNTQPGMNSDHNKDDSSINSTTDTEMTETNMISYKGFEVVQKAIVVKKGTTVTWTNEDSAKHDVTPVTETEEFKTSELFGKGETYSVTFNTVGKYSYFCSPHPYMKGTIEVTE